MNGTYMPPGGVAGFAQMTPASRLALTGGAPRARSSGKRRRKVKAAKRTKRASGKRRGGGKMKFGSPAWQKKYRVGKFAKKR